MSVLFILLLLAFIYMTVLGSSNNNTEEKHGDKSNNKTKLKRMTLENQAKVAEVFLDEFCKEAHGAGNYKIKTSVEKNIVSVKLDVNTNASVAQEGIKDPKEWNNLIDAMTRYYNELNNNLKKLKCEDVVISFILGDFSLDTVYLVMINGKVVYDYVNNINNMKYK